MTFWRLWILAFIALLAGAAFELALQPDLGSGGLSFEPDLSRVADLIDGPGRLLGHAPWLFFTNAAILAGILAIVLAKGNRD